MLVTLLAAVTLTGCSGGGGSSSSSTSDVTISISGLRSGALSAAAAGSVVAIQFTISAPDMETISRTVQVAGIDTVRERFEIPNGNDRHFLAVALSQDSSVLSQGDALSDIPGRLRDREIEIVMGVDVSGEWTVTHTVPGGRHSDFVTYSQSGNALTLTGDHVGRGTVTGNDVQMNFVSVKDCAEVSATGAIFSDGTAGGTFRASGTTQGGCQFVEGSYDGTWRAVRGHIAPFDITGAWSFFNTPQGGTEEGPVFITLTQSGSTLTSSVVPDEGGVKTGNGTINGATVQLSFAESKDRCGNTVPFSLLGIVSPDGNTIDGTYTVPGSCGENGTWRATKALPPASDISGNWAGYMTPQGGTEQGPACLTFTQTGSYFTISGVNGGSGILSGNAIRMRFVESGGGNGGPSCKIVDQLSGTVSGDGNSAGGTFTTDRSRCGLGPGAGIWRAVKGGCAASTPPPQGHLTGIVTDAVTGAGLAGVTVTLSRQGSTVATVTTVANGAYTVTAASASGYSIQFAKTGYITSTIDPVHIPVNTTTQLNAVLSPLLSSGQARIVLTWDYAKGQLDLDAHLKGPRASGDTIAGPFHTWFGERIYSFGGTKYAELDIDWITPSDGPVPQETTTIYQQVSGTYTFYVHDYTNGGATGSTALSNSTAQVRVYIGSSLAATYNVPAGAGTVWTVFQLNGTQLTPINSMSANETVLQSVSRKGSLKKAGRTLR